MCELVELTITFRITDAIDPPPLAVRTFAPLDSTHGTEGWFAQGGKRLLRRLVQRHTNIDVIHLNAIGKVFVLSPPANTPSWPDWTACSLKLDRGPVAEADLLGCRKYSPYRIALRARPRACRLPSGHARAKQCKNRCSRSDSSHSSHCGCECVTAHADIQWAVLR